MSTIKYVYVAGPMTEGGTGGTGANIREAVVVARILKNRGFVPFVPHLTFLWDLLEPASYESWMAWCFAWVLRCDAVIRLPGVSLGADREVALARENGIPTFGEAKCTAYGPYRIVDELLEFVNGGPLQVEEK